MKVIKIDVTKIKKELLFAGKNGAKYLDAALHERPNEYGDAGFITQSVSKEARAKGEKGPIIGNWKRVGEDKKPAQATAQRTSAPPTQATAPSNDDSSDVPF